jgi:outer membrane usher protein FimD/PapC
VEYRNEEYRVIDDADELSPARSRVIVDGSVSYGFADGPQFSLSTRWRSLYNDTQRTSLTLAGNQRIGDTGSLSVRMGPEWQDGTMTWRGAIFLRVFPGSGQVATSVNYDLTDGPATVSVYPQGGSGLRRFRWNGQVRGFDNTAGSAESVSARLGYEAYRWEVAATPRAIRDVDSGETEAQSTFQGATALVFAGRSVSISRPVRSSFAIFVARDTVAGNEIGIQPVGDDYRAIIGRLPGVVPDLRSYRPNLINLDGTGLPEGLSLGETTYRFDPVYGAGYRIVVGSEATVYVTGTLVDRLNRNPGLAFGIATAADGAETLFFSDETGYFEIHELKPGTYTLLVDADGRRYTTEIDIAADSRGRIELGPVVIDDEGAEE